MRNYRGGGGATAVEGGGVHGGRPPGERHERAGVVGPADDDRQGELPPLLQPRRRLPHRLGRVRRPGAAPLAFP